jgi:molecular chaperone GrpE (heat shock protein)
MVEISLPPSSEKEQLKEKLIAFQQTIAELKQALAQKEALFHKKEKSSLLNLLEIMDALAFIEKNLETKKDTLDKTAKMLGRNIVSIHKKLRRHFYAASIVPLEFPDNKATMEYCKVLETREDPGLENEVILEIIKNGYKNKEVGTVLRKAEVITVLNH